MEFPNRDVLEFLKQHGQLQSNNLHRLYYSDEGLHHIERSIRVAEISVLVHANPYDVMDVIPVNTSLKVAPRSFMTPTCSQLRGRDRWDDLPMPSTPPDRDAMDIQALQPDLAPSTLPLSVSPSQSTDSGNLRLFMRLSYAAVTQELLPDSPLSDSNRKRPPFPGEGRQPYA